MRVWTVPDPGQPGPIVLAGSCYNRAYPGASERAIRQPAGSKASGNVQCQNGLTPDGKVCVDDNDEQHGGACVQCENGVILSGECRPVAAVGDNVQCENGVDPNGQPCPDGPDTAGGSNGPDTAGGSESAASQMADGDSLQCQDGKDAVTGAACAQDNRSPAEGAVADHNLPQNVGCDGGEVGSGS